MKEGNGNWANGRKGFGKSPLFDSTLVSHSDFRLLKGGRYSATTLVGGNVTYAFFFFFFFLFVSSSKSNYYIFYCVLIKFEKTITIC